LTPFAFIPHTLHHLFTTCSLPSVDNPNPAFQRPPTRGGTVYDQYHKVQKTIHDDDPANNIYKKTPEQMFEMKMQLKYGSPLVGGCMDWGNETEWVTTMRPGGVERGSAAMIKR